MKRRPSITVVDEISLAGKLSEGKFTLRIKGQATGTPSMVEWMNAPENSRIRRCEGNILVYRSERGYSFVPKGEKFFATCEFLFRQQESLMLEFTKAVIDVRPDINDAQVTEQSTGDGGLRMVFSRRSTSQVQRVSDGKVMVVPRYRLTITSDQIIFRYDLNFDNPNSQAKPFLLSLVNGEIVNQVKTHMPNELRPKELILQVRPGQSLVSVLGQLKVPHFQPLLDQEEQYLLLEFHPLVALKLTKEAARIGIEQTGMTPTYQAAIAFLVGRGKEIEWETKTREVFDSDSYTGLRADYLVYLPIRGQAIIDSSWTFRNQGKPSVALRLPSKPYFASSDGVPQVLAKTEDNELFLPLRTGTTSIRVQYDPSKQLPRLGGFWQTDLVKPATVLPEANVELRTDAKHAILVANFLGETKFPWFQTVFLFGAMVAAILWFGTMTHLAQTSKSGAGLAALAVFILSLESEVFPFFLSFLCAIAYALAYRTTWINWVRTLFTHSWKGILVGIVILSTVGLTLLAIFSVFLSMSSKSLKRAETDSRVLMQEYNAGISQAPKSDSSMDFLDREGKSKIQLGEPAEAQADESYLGLPVERVVPATGKRIWLKEISIPPERRLPLRLFVVHRGVTALLGLCLFLIAFYPVANRRQVLFKRIHVNRFTS